MSRILAVAITMTLLSCGPVFRTQFNYTPPATPEGRGCISQCEGQRAQCEALEQQRNMLCEQQSQMQHQTCVTQADSAYSSCTASGNTSCFRNVCIRRPCFVNLASCEQPYNRCYSTCGGQVQEEQVCVRRCE